MIRRNTASQSFLIGPLLNQTTGAAETTGAAIQLAQDSGAFSASSGTLTHISDGVYRYAPTAGETNGAQVHAILSKSGAIAVPLTIATTQANPQDAVGFGLTGVTVGTINAGTITATSIASGALTAAKFASGAFDAVWTVATRSLTTFGTLVSDIWGHASRTLTAISDSAGVTTLLSRILGVLAAGTHQPQTGDSFARIGVNGAGLTALGDTRLGDIAAIKAKTDNLPTDPADASDIAASFASITSTLSTIASYIDTEVAAIKAKTDNLPTDPADASDIAASFASVTSALSTIAGYIDTEVAAIKAKTDLLTFSGSNVNANVEQVNNVNLQGAGTAGDKWRPA